MIADLLNTEKKYLSTNLIAYIGNKRRLLPLLYESFSQIPLKKGGLFVDFFAGTGVVSRLAKSMGYKVFCNDWEDYSYCLNKAFIQENKSFLNRFEQNGRFYEILSFLNEHAGEYKEEWAYISKFYCPQNDEDPDVLCERMFYTRANGIRIDNMRMYIEDFHTNGVISLEEKNFLLALLLVESSIRSNTSGVFKGFHQGFGGRKKDALSRILHPVLLKTPYLSDSTEECQVFCQDASNFSKYLNQTQKGSYIAYLDPPYNQHQYGSNYHMLNTIYRNDRPPIQQSFWVKGKKVAKSGIRKDWVKTRSAYCVREKAVEEFSQLVKSIDSEYVVVSYSTDGIIGESSLLDILSMKGKLRVFTKEYTKFRGRRQRNLSGAKSIEFVAIVNTQKKFSKNFYDSSQAFLEIELKKNQQLCEELVVPKYFCDVFCDSKGIFFWMPKENYLIPLTNQLRICPSWYEENKQEHLKIFFPSVDLKEKMVWVLYVIRNFFNSSCFIDEDFFLKNLINLFNRIDYKNQKSLYDFVLKEIQNLQRNFLIFDKHSKLYERFCKVMETQLVA